MQHKLARNPWIGVDLDGTLAVHGQGPYDPLVVGPPIPRMQNRVLDWLNAGIEVRIVTARVSLDHDPDGAVKQAIEAWCVENLGRVIPVTCCKDYNMIELWDDRARQVEFNTGVAIGESD